MKQMMNGGEKDSLRQFYASLSTDELLAIIQKRAEQYSPEALLLIKSELCSRNVAYDTTQPNVSTFQEVPSPGKQMDVKPVSKKFKWSRVFIISLVLVFMYTANIGIIITDAFSLWMAMFCGLKIPPPPEMGFKYYELLLAYSFLPLICIFATFGWLIMMRSRWLTVLATPSILIHLSWIWMLWDFILHGNLDVPFKIFFTLMRLMGISLH
jgi:hypothetical protein